jgi:VWFA-related protein
MSHKAVRLLSALVAIGATLAVAFPGVTFAARPAKDKDKQQPVFSDEARITAVEVPVHVTDRSGSPLTGLSAQDFEVYDEGALQAITGFEVIDLGSPAATTGSRPPTDELPPAARRHLLLLFDISFSDPTSVLRARVAARDFAARQLHPSDLVAVATYSHEGGPRLIVTFTPDRAQVAHAIDSLGLDRSSEIDPLRFIIQPRGPEGQDSSGQFNPANRTEVSSGRGAIAREHFAILAELMDKSERSFKRSQITAFSRSLGELARFLGTIQGRKQVVLFSEGFDSRLLTGNPLGDLEAGDQRSLLIATGALARGDSDELYGSTELQRHLRQMVEEFRRSDCTIQAIDIGGLRAQGDIRDASPLNMGEEGLFYMANETGGELFKDANNLGAQLSEVLERTSLTYLLTFEPQRLSYDGRFHRLKVRLKDRPGREARVSHRMGYYEPRPFEQLHPLEKDLLAADAIATAARAQEIDVDVLLAAFRATAEWAYVPIIVEIDGTTLMAGQKGERLQVEIYAYATDAEGSMRGFFAQEVGLDVSRGRDQLAQKGLKYYGHLELPPGEYRARVLVRNSETGRTAVAVTPLAVPRYEELQTVVLPPFFPEQPGRWVMVRERQEDSQGGSTVYPFTLKGEPYVPAARPEIERGGEASFCLVAYNLSQGAVTLAGEVLDASGLPVEGGTLRLVERTSTGIEGYDKLVGNFAVADLAAGEYTLRVALTDPASGRTEVNTIAFDILN